MSTPPQPPTKKERRDAAREARVEAEQASAASAQRKRRLAIILGSIAAAAVIAIILIAVAGGGNDAASTAAKTGKAKGGADTAAEFAGIPQAGVGLGNPKAKVTVVEFIDAQCPICKAFSNDTFPTINQNYIRTGKIYYQFRTLHFLDNNNGGTDSIRGAQFLNAAGFQNKMANATSLLYRNQGTEGTGYMTDKFLRSIGNAIPGFNTEKAMVDRNTPKAKALVATADALGARYSVDGTPTLLVGPTGGTLAKINYTNVSSPAEFQAGIDAALKLNP